MCNCSRNIKDNTPIMRQIERPANAESIKSFIESEGWTYVGLCGCKDNMLKWTNPDFPKWEVRTNSYKMQIKKYYGTDKDPTPVKVGMLANYKSVYAEWKKNYKPTPF
jgi:hypothetical protein